MKLQQQDVRVEALRRLCAQKGASALLLELSHNTAWLLGGRTHVGLAGSQGICQVLVTEERIYLITSNIEGERLRQEELGGDVLEIFQYPWYSGGEQQAFLHRLCPQGYLTERDCEGELYELRTCLLPEEREELRKNCRTASALMEAVCGSVKKGMTEHALSGLLAERCYRAGMEPIVVLAAGEKRLPLYRHPLSTDTPVERFAMLSLGARKNGRYVSITRTVSFGEPEEQLRETQGKVNRLAAMLYTEAVPGIAGGVLCKKLQAAYEKEGIGAEFFLHHQGGASGFQARESKITPEDPHILRHWQAYAFNPSAGCYKNEDMLLVGEQHNEVLTATPGLPTEQVEYRGRVYTMPTIVVL